MIGRSSVFGYRTFGKIASVPNYPQIDLERYTAKGALYKLKYYHESQISLRFALQSVIFQMIEVFFISP